MDAKHTEGPWTWDGPFSLKAGAVEVLGIGLGYDGLWGGETPSVADARLIAAAPDLLAACKAVLSCETHHDEGGRAYLRVPARSLNDLSAAIAAVVAKAEGAQ